MREFCYRGRTKCAHTKVQTLWTNYTKLPTACSNAFLTAMSRTKMVTRLAEECGELASEVSHWENSGVKRQKRGEPSKESLAAEIKNVLTCAVSLAICYGVESDLELSIEQSISRLKEQGHVD